MSGSKAGVISWALAGVIAMVVFQADVNVLASGTLKGIWSTFFVLFIIWSSMFLYNLVNVTGSFEVIADTFTELTNGNKLLQLLILGWVFPTFIQGVCGFGVPVAVAAPLLIGLGFDPKLSVVTALLGHAWGVTFGSLGSSYSVLLQQAPIEAEPMAFWASIFIAFGGVLTGFAILHNYDGMKAVKEGAIASIFLSIVMGGALILTAFVSPYVATFVAGAVGLVAGSFILPKFPQYRLSETDQADFDAADKTEGNFGLAFSAYIILIIVVFAVYLIPPLNNLLSQFQVGLAFPETSIGHGLVNESIASYSPLVIFTTPGTLIVISSILAAIFYNMNGLLPEGGIKTAFQRTLSQSIGSTQTIIPMTMMAVLMTEAGLTLYIAYGIAGIAGGFFPIASPFIGLLGGFVTSSGTSSNILFTSLQYEVANILDISPYIILAMQTTASSLSNSFSPGNAALGTGVSGLDGQEGAILKDTGKYNIIMNLLVGILGYILVSMGLGF
jgi:lactate permease